MENISFVEVSSQLLKDCHRLVKPLKLEEFNSKFSQLIQKHLGIDLLENPKKYLFRFFYLEEDSAKRQERLKKIKGHGSDRTSRKLKPIPPYQEASSESGIDHLDLFACGSLPHFSQNYSEGKHNALLIYDSEKIYRPAGGVEYTFKGSQMRNNALVGIVGLI